MDEPLIVNVISNTLSFFIYNTLDDKIYIF